MAKIIKNYDRAIDALRMIAILGVVLIHTTTKTIEFYHEDLIHHTLTLYFNQMVRFAVPLFFLISGFVLTLSFDENLSYFEFIKKRVSRIFVPYVFWSFIYYFFVYTNHSDSFLSAIIYGSASYQLYFIPSLFVFYMIFPFLYKIVKKINFVFMVVLFFVQVVILYFAYKNFSFPLPYPLAVSLFNFFVFIFGIFAARKREYLIKFVNKYRSVLFVCTAMISYFVFREGIGRFYQTYNFEAFYTQWRISVLIYTIFVFWFLYCVFRKIKNNLMQALSKLSFFVYFVHVIFIELIVRFLPKIMIDKFGILFFGLVIVLSFGSAWVFHKFKLSKITG